MAISDIVAGNVLAAVAEFDCLGREAFLDKYGFGRSRSYWLVLRGRTNDSKAVVGAAHGFARPDLGPLLASSFVGGAATVQRKLEALGFRVDVEPPVGT